MWTIQRTYNLLLPLGYRKGIGEDTYISALYNRYIAVYIVPYIWSYIIGLFFRYIDTKRPLYTGTSKISENGE